MKTAHGLKDSLSRYLLSFMGGSIVTIIALMPYHAFLSTWLGTLIGPLLAWKSWKEILLASIVLAAMMYAAMHPDLLRRLLRQPLTILIFAYAGLHLLLALLFSHPLEPTIAGLLTNLRFLAIFLVAQLLLLIVPKKVEKWHTLLTKILLVSTVVVSLFGLLQVTVLPKDFLTPFGYSEELTIAPYILVDEQEGAYRAFSTLRGPNTLGMFLLLPIALLAVLIWRRYKLAFTIPVLILALLTLFATGSRSAWIGAMVTLAVLALALIGRERTMRYMRRWGIAALVLAVLLIVAAFEYPPLRLAIFHSNPNDPTLTEGSTDAHLSATLGGLRDAFFHPFGRGPGQAGPASFYSATPRVAENYYVQIAQEVGIAGLVLLFAILFLVARKLWRLSSKENASPLTLALMTSFWGIAVINILLHGWADDPVSLIWWGLAGLTLPLDNET